MMMFRSAVLRASASTMTSIVDSTAHFAQRAEEVGLSAHGLASVKRHGFDSMIHWENWHFLLASQQCK